MYLETSNNEAQQLIFHLHILRSLHVSIITCITNSITNWTPKMGEEMITSEIGRTLNTWSGYSRLNFKPIHSPYPEIITAFNKQSHNEESVLQNKKKIELIKIVNLFTCVYDLGITFYHRQTHFLSF